MTSQPLQDAFALIERHYGPRLVAGALFGSRARGRARADSDWDLLLVLADREAIRRDLYREWDVELASAIDAILPGATPHFVHLPAPDVDPSGFWLEVALAHVVVHDPAGSLTAHLASVARRVEAGDFERGTVYGLPYWRRAG